MMPAADEFGPEANGSDSWLRRRVHRRARRFAVGSAGGRGSAVPVFHSGRIRSGVETLAVIRQPASQSLRPAGRPPLARLPTSLLWGRSLIRAGASPAPTPTRVLGFRVTVWLASVLARTPRRTRVSAAPTICPSARQDREARLVPQPPDATATMHTRVSDPGSPDLSRVRRRRFRPAI
jgi:hypothetical protein